jgi:hypothetical protein
LMALTSFLLIQRAFQMVGHMNGNVIPC